MAGRTTEESAFLSVWQRLAQLGVCDAPFGAEYERVWCEYRSGCYGMHYAEFIRWRANIGPVGAKNGK